MKVLVTLGNTNLGTFENVCHAVQTVYPNQVGVLLVFDTPESLADCRESTRNQRVREILPGAQVRSQPITDSDMQTTIPLAVARLIGEVGLGSILIDLTNGQKAATGILYAVASISLITAIHSLEIRDKANIGKPLPTLRRADWEYVSLQPLREIDAVAQQTFLELLYYQRDIRELCSLLEGEHPAYAQSVAPLLNLAVEDYFGGRADPARYAASVKSSGLICEDIAKALFDYCRQSGKTDVEADNAEKCINQVGQILQVLRGAKADWDKEGHFGRQMMHLLLADLLLRTVQALRNLTSHPKGYDCRQDEARLALDTALMLLKRLRETDVLRRVR